MGKVKEGKCKSKLTSVLRISKKENYNTIFEEKRDKGHIEGT